MKHYLWQCALITAVAALASCSGGSNNYNPVPIPTSTPQPGPTATGMTPTGTTVAIPPNGGSVTSGVGPDGIVANQTFASAPIGATVTIADYGESTPPNAPMPSSKARSLASRSAQASGTAVTVVFHSVTLNFNRPLTGSQYTSQVLTNDVPVFAAPYALTVADEATPGTVLFTSTGTQPTDGTLTFPVPANATFVAGHTYVGVASGQQATLLPMQVVNNTGLSGYVFIESGNPTNGAGFYYANGVGLLVAMNPADGSLTKPSPGWTPTPPQVQSTPLPAGGSYFITSSAYVRPLAAGATIPIPLGRSQRYYFSVSRPIAIQVDNNATGPAWAPSAPWSTPGEVNIDTPFDWIESNFFLDGNGIPTLGPNNTALQMFGLPLTYTLTGPNGTVTAGFMGANARSQVLAALRADSVYSKLIYTGNNPSVNPVRAISPDNGIFNLAQNRAGLPTMDKTQLQAYLDYAWTYYQTHSLIFHTDGLGDYSGMVTSNNLVLTSSLGGQPTVTIGKPSVYWAIVNGGKVNDASEGGCTPVGGQCDQLTSILSAGFNRGVLALNNPPYTDQLYRVAPCVKAYVQTFYTNPTAGWLNLYAKIMHQFSYPTPDAYFGGSYGFGFEDNCDQSSLISGAAERSPTGFTVTINPM